MNNFLKLAFLFLLPVCVRAQVPTATIISPNPTVCTGVSLTFSTITSNTPTAYNWIISPSLSVTSLPDNTSNNITYTFGRPGVYTSTLMVSNSSGTTIAVKTITVFQTATAAFNASLTNTGYPTQLVLTNYSTNSLNNYWFFSDVATKDSLNAVKDYTASGSYTVTLLALGSNGCDSWSSYSFYISDSSGISAPTIFTPNNDGTNDIFRPIARGISSMNVWIYSRYGTLVASWDKVRGFWDGYTTSGEPCQEGVYFYVIEATGFDGKSYKLKNNLTLIR
ncbi:MAG: T9SS type B sorting domain-containing protein [Bacteroidia bacterium]